MKRFITILAAFAAILLSAWSCDVDQALLVQASLQYETDGGVAGFTETYPFNVSGSYVSESDATRIFNELSSGISVYSGLLTMDIFDAVSRDFIEQQRYVFQRTGDHSYSCVRER